MMLSSAVGCTLCEWCLHDCCSGVANNTCAACHGRPGPAVQAALQWHIV